MANLFLKVPGPLRKRSGSFSEARGIARSLSVERPGTPRPVEMEARGYVDSSTSGFRKPMSKDCHFFGSLDSLSGQKRSNPSSNNNRSRISQEIVKRAFSTEAVMEAKEVEQGDNKKILASTLSEEEMMKMNFYSKFTPTSVSLSHFLDHSSGGGTIEDSFVFLRREIPVRLSNMMMELELLPEELLSQPACQEIIAQYGKSFQDILAFENSPNNPETHALFNETITNVRHRHQDTVPRMAEALHNMRDDGNLNVNSKDKLNQALQYFLDRLYMSRISIQMLVAHHKSLFCENESKRSTHGLTGTIDPSCDPVRIAEEAFENAAFLCDQIYMDAPKLNIKCSNLTDGSDKINFVYIPSHLYHMFFEVFKNSMRATMEFHEDAETVPTIDVHIVRSSHDITIKISDQGGGISRSVADNVFLYLYTSATRVKLSGGDMGGTTSISTPMHGLGYGLPLSRLYSRYFGGDIKIASCDGYGTDAYIYLKALETDARETLPIFNASSSSKIRDTKNQVEDWTKDE